MTEPTPAQPAPGPNSRFNWVKALKISALVLVSAFAGAAASRAHFWHHHWHGPGYMGQAIDPAEADRRIDWVTTRMAREVKASDEQRTKVADIAKAAAKDLMPLREQMQDVRKQVRELLTQPTVDRAALEKLRADQIATLDALSKRLVTAVSDAADVLTPEQRKELADRFPLHPDWHGPWHRS